MYSTLDRRGTWHGVYGRSCSVVLSAEEVSRSRVAIEQLESRRLLSAGELDPSFGTGGKVVTDFGGTDSGQAVAVQSDGRIVVVGHRGEADFVLARYNANGTLDTTFGSVGRVTTDFGGQDAAFAVAVQADGRIVTAGRSGGAFALARYNVDGSLDAAFGSGGKVVTDLGTTDPTSTIFDIAVQPDGKIVAAGTRGFDDFALARYNPDGTLDSSFGTGGVVVTDFGPGFDGAGALELQIDGRIVVAGQAGVDDGHKDFALARYLPDGTLDTAFGGTGLVTTDFSGAFDGASGLVVQPDGKIVAAGISGFSDVALARYNSDGSLDPTFGSGGRVVTELGDFDVAFELVRQSDGKLVTAGERGGDFAVIRYNADGTLDGTFGAGGVTITDFGTPNDIAFGAAIEPDGGIVAAGQTSGDFAVARYLAATLTPAQEVQGVANELAAIVSQGAALTQSQANGLLAKLDAAKNQLNQNRDDTAVRLLEAFENQVQGYISGGKLTQQNGDALISATDAIIAQLLG